MRGFASRIVGCIRASIPKAIRTSVWLLAVMLPISLAVMLLRYFGLLDWLARLLSPAFRGFGLSGTAPLVFITAATLNLYSAIAVIETLSLGIREVTILAIMCLIAHNLPVETAIQRKTGSPVVAILATRLGAAVIGALLLAAVLPTDRSVDGEGLRSAQTVTAAGPNDTVSATNRDEGTAEKIITKSLADLLDDAPGLALSWLAMSIRTSMKIVLIVVGLLVLQNLLTEFRLAHRLTSFFRPVLRAFGLPDSTHFLWIVANTLGLAYGAAVLVEEVEQERLSVSDADLLNRHIAVSHSLLEDTLLFVAIGVGAFWLLAPRLILAFASVWLARWVSRWRAPWLSRPFRVARRRTPLAVLGVPSRRRAE